MRVTEHAVVVVGGGPTGMMLAGELALAGVDVAIVERRSDQVLAGSRAGGLHARTIEIFDQRGIADRFLAEGQVAQVGQFAGVPLDISGFPTRHPYSLGLWQNHIERVLAGWVDEFGVPVRRGFAVADVRPDDDGVEVRSAGGDAVRARFVVGCDGGRSVVRKSTGIPFPGWDATTSSLIAQVELTETPEWGVRYDARGVHGLGRVDYVVRDGEIVYADSGPVRVMITEEEVGAAGEPTEDELRAALVSVYGTDYGLYGCTWVSRFTDATRQAAHYRSGRVLLAGDAAHVHSPAGGQGLQLGVQDAVNLGWKLAQVVHGTSPERLLDTYAAERHPAGARVLQLTMALVALLRQDDRTAALRDTVAELLAADEPRVRTAARLAGLDIRYDLGDGHPLLGRRIPDLDLVTGDGPRRVFELLHPARPLLLDLGSSAALDITGWDRRVHHVVATCSGTWELPALGAVTPPSAVLVRPDGYVAWVGEGGGAGLHEALATWFGAPQPAGVTTG